MSHDWWHSQKKKAITKEIPKTMPMAPSVERVRGRTEARHSVLPTAAVMAKIPIMTMMITLTRIFGYLLQNNYG